MKKVKIKGQKLAYDEIGRGPAVVLINSSDSKEEGWPTESQRLVEEGFRVIRLDLQSASTVAGCVADNVIGLLNYLGVGRAAFVGASLGGTIVHELVERFPRRVSATVDLAWVARSEAGRSSEITACLVDFLKRVKLGQFGSATLPQMG